jgi:hypothetical protein
MGLLPGEQIKGVDDKDDGGQEMLPLIFTHTYDTVEINTTVPWPELHPKTQRIALRVVDYYRMTASIRVDANVQIKKLNITEHNPESGVAYSLVATVEPLGDNDIEDLDIEALFQDENDDYYPTNDNDDDDE